MKNSKKILVTSLICTAFTLPLLTNKLANNKVISVKAETEITKEDAFNTINGKMYVLPSTPNALTITGTNLDDGVFTLSVNEGEHATGDTPYTFNLSILLFNVNETVNFVTLGGYSFKFSLDYISVHVDSRSFDYLTGDYYIGSNVTLDSQGGTDGDTSVVTAYGYEMPNITVPTKLGFVFEGYFDAQSEGTQYYSENGESCKNWDKTDKDVTLYAHWSEAKLPNSGLSGGAIAGIVIGSIAGICLITYIILFIVFLKTEKSPKFLVKSYKRLAKLFRK